MSKPREWTISGGLGLRERLGSPPGNFATTNCAGPIPNFGEKILAREVLPGSVTITRDMFWAAAKRAIDQADDGHEMSLIDLESVLFGG